MAPASVLLAFMLLTVAASLNVPTCPPGEEANVVSESMFPVVSPFGSNPTINLTLTYFTCPSLQAQARRGALKRQGDGPVDACLGLVHEFEGKFVSRSV
jgi:hypothetical protein